MYGKNTWFEQIGIIHNDIHALGQELLVSFAVGQKNETLMRLNELHALSHTLTEKLRDRICVEYQPAVY